MAIARGSTCDPGATCATDVGNVVARIHGPSGRRCWSAWTGSPSAVAEARRTPPRPARAWSYEDLSGVAIGQYGSLPVSSFSSHTSRSRCPILILERGQVGPALDGLVTLRRLIAAAAARGRHTIGVDRA